MKPVGRVLLSNLGYRTLSCEIGEEPLVIVFSIGLRHIVENTAWMRDNLGYRVIWATRDIKGIRHDWQNGVIGTNVQSISEAMKYRKRKDNIVSIFVLMAAPHTALWRWKAMIPQSRVIVHFYDVMSLWVPREHRALWDEYPNTKGSNEAEYDALEEILRGDYVDGFSYKDWGGPFWPVLEKAEERGIPTVWIPSSCSSKLYQAPPKPTVPNRIAYVGTVVPRSSHDQPGAIFGDVFMEKIFMETFRQGFEIHAYSVGVHKDAVADYRKAFPNREVSLLGGASLTDLMPRLAGRYRWGWAAYHYPQPAIMGLVKNTLPTKIFNYMALGVPIILSEEMEVASRFVRHHGIGVVVSQEDLKNLNVVLGRYNYSEMLANILRVRDDFSTEKHIDKLGRLVETVMKAPSGRKLTYKAPWLEKDMAWWKNITDKKSIDDDRTKYSAWRATNNEIPLNSLRVVWSAPET